MSVISYFSDLLEEVFVPSVAYADDEPVEEPESEEPTDEEESSEDGDSEEPEAEGDGDDDDEEEEDDDDEDEDEPEDIYPALREEAAEGPCHSFKHHFDECIARVTAAQEEEGYEDREYKEDCVEEYFHLNHCIDEVAAPALFRKLK